MEYLATRIEQGLQPSAIDEDGDTTLIGYFQNGDPSRAAICQVQKDGSVTTFKYVNGLFMFAYDWESRWDYDYFFRKDG